ncbi:MAG: class I SAM-dependent methyltransferase [Woeseiaceae bacterium]
MKYPVSFYFKLFGLHLKQNGFFWTLFFSIKHVLVESLRAVDGMLRWLEKKFDLPGTHSVAENALKWNNYGWSEGEDEWNVSKEWKESVIEHIMLGNIEPDKVVLEIGPGFGRWTRKLIEVSNRLISIDITEKCIEHCKQVFGHNDNVEFHLNDGRNLDVVADNSIDFVWSFDVFVHIEPPDVASYLQEFRRVLKDGGIAIIHHGIGGNADMNWRSSLTLQAFNEMLDDNNFELIKQFDSWGDKDEYKVATTDSISIFRKK